MRLTDVLRGGGGGGPPKWGFAFQPTTEYGTLEDRVRGIVTYRISPYEQRAFAGVLNNMSNTIGRIAGVVFLVLPYFTITWGVQTIATQLHNKYTRKNPADYKQYYQTAGEPVAYKKKIKKKWPK